jgi:hypothetical protein
VATSKPITALAIHFVETYLGRSAFAPFTGQDTSGWFAFVYLLEMYGRGDAAGRRAALAAMGEVLRGVQNLECIHRVFIQTIPHVLDWGYVAEIWPKLGSNWDLRPFEATQAQRRT